MATVKFDSVEIVNSTYAPKDIRHESAPERELTLLNLAREDGSVLISEKYGTKVISITGSLKAASQTTLETAIDNFKELFSRKEKNLDIGWGGGTRRYVATCVRFNFNRGFFNINFIPWVAEFIVVTGIGEDTSETTLVNNQNFTAADYSSSMTFAGSANPKPRIRVKCGVAATDPKGLSIENTDNGERMVITRADGFGAGDYFEIDCRLKTVKYDGDEVPFYGVFPSWIVGANAYEIKIGDIVDQSFTQITGVTTSALYGTDKRAQSFTVPYGDTTYQGLEIYLRKQGTLANDMTIEIWNDSGGSPDSGDKVTNAVFTLAKGDVGVGFDWLKVNSANPFTLEANTKYWIVMTTSGGDGSNCYLIGYQSGAANATYKRGNKADYVISWVDAPNDDILFKLLYGGKADAAKTYYFDVYYYKRFL